MKVKKKDRQDPSTSENPSVHLSIYHLFYNKWRSPSYRQDYHIWKSQDTVLQLSSRGNVHAETESSLPKTYSTRKGPLLLYSQVSNHINLDTTVQKISIGLYLYWNWHTLFCNPYSPSPVFGFFGNQLSITAKRQEEGNNAALRSPNRPALGSSQRTNICLLDQQKQSGKSGKSGKKRMQIKYVLIHDKSNNFSLAYFLQTWSTLLSSSSASKSCLHLLHTRTKQSSDFPVSKLTTCRKKHQISAESIRRCLWI